MAHAAEAVYLLCALTSLACMVLLLRGYMRSRARILLWSVCCFAFLAANNALLFVDLVIFPAVDLVPYRDLTAFLAMAVLVVGLILDAD
jgi:hypothetical protein